MDKTVINTVTISKEYYDKLEDSYHNADLNKLHEIGKLIHRIHELEESNKISNEKCRIMYFKYLSLVATVNNIPRWIKWIFSVELNSRNYPRGN